MRSCYVKYGLVWTILQEQNHVYLSNCLTLKLFQIAPSYQDIAKEISNGADINELSRKYGDNWCAFRKQLEDNRAVYYSKNKTILGDKLDYGTKIALQSNYTPQIPPITQLNIQINENCTLDCTNCSNTTMYECMSCHADKKRNRHIDIDLAASAIEFLSHFGIKSLMIQGGDPFLDYDILIYLARKFRSYIPNGDVFILTNGSIFTLLSAEKIEDIKALGCQLIISIVDDNNGPYDNFKNFASKYGIKYHIQMRDCSIQRPGIFSNNTIAFTAHEGKALVEPSKIIRPTNLYNNTIMSLFNNCYYGKVFLSVDGLIGTCKNNLLNYKLTKNNWNDVLPQINNLWKTNPSIKCNKCGLRRICFSCDALQQSQRIKNSVKTCFLQI